MPTPTEYVQQHLRDRGITLTHFEIRSRSVGDGTTFTTVTWGGASSQRLIDRVSRILVDLPGRPDVVQTETVALRVQWTAPVG